MPGARPSATASARPRPPCRWPIPPASRSRSAPWAGRCPGYDVVLVDPATGEEADDGELCLRLDPRPAGLMKAYHGDPQKTAEAFRGGYYHTGDMASRDERRHHHLRGPRRRRLQVLRLPAVPVRAGERAHRAPGGGGGRRRPLPGPAASCRCPRRSWCWPPGTSPARSWPRRSCATAATTWRRSSASAGWSSPSCPRPSPAKSAGWNCGTARNSATAAAPAGAARCSRRPRHGILRNWISPGLKSQG